MEDLGENKMWISVLETVGFEEKDFDKINEYVKTHIWHEQNAPIVFENALPYSTLSMALQVLKRLDLERIHFQEQPAGTGDVGIRTEVRRLKFRFEHEDLMCVPDIEMTMAHQFVDETVKALNEKLEIGDLFIYLLFNNIVTEGLVCSVFHRFGTRVL
jgi:hypothetical protein